MKKEYTAKFYDKKDGTPHYSNGSYTHQVYCGTDKKEAFLEARKELARMAKLDENGNNDKEVGENIESINNGSNSYYYDQHIFHFIMFSKKIK